MTYYVEHFRSPTYSDITVSIKIDIRRARAGENSAIESLVTALRPRVTKMAGYYARSTGENADDLLQEAWVGLLDALPEVDLRIGDPVQYLLQHARWRMLDAVKRWKRRRFQTLEDDHLASLPTSDWNVVESEVWVDEFAECLKPTQRAVLENLLKGMTWREAGDQLGCSSANVAYHVRQIQRSYETWNEAEDRPAPRTPQRELVGA